MRNGVVSTGAELGAKLGEAVGVMSIFFRLLTVTPTPVCFSYSVANDDVSFSSDTDDVTAAAIDAVGKPITAMTLAAGLIVGLDVGLAVGVAASFLLSNSLPPPGFLRKLRRLVVVNEEVPAAVAATVVMLRRVMRLGETPRLFAREIFTAVLFAFVASMPEMVKLSWIFFKAAVGNIEGRRVGFSEGAVVGRGDGRGVGREVG